MSVLIMIAVVDKNAKLFPHLNRLFQSETNEGGDNLKPLHFTDLNDIWGSASWTFLLLRLS